MEDSIQIQGLQASTRIGVPDEERARWQTVEIDLKVTPCVGFAELEDDLARTVDYHELSLKIRDLAAERPRKLIETLADELAASVLADYPLREVALTVRKFVLPGTQWVAVSVTRSQ